MKNLHYVDTKYTKEAERCLNEVLARDVDELVGAMVVQGITSTGKSRWATQMSLIQESSVLVRTDCQDTPLSFFERMFHQLSKLHNEYPHVGRRASMMKAGIREILENHPNTVIYIDEVDHIVRMDRKNRDIFEGIRDLLDTTYCVVVFVGEENLDRKILRFNTHYFNRVLRVTEFKRLTKTEFVEFLRNQRRSFKIDDSVIKWVLSKLGEDAGNSTGHYDLRQAEKVLEILDRKVANGEL